MVKSSSFLLIASFLLIINSILGQPLKNIEKLDIQEEEEQESVPRNDGDEHNEWVHTKRDEKGRHVGVHIPGVYNMDMLTGNNKTGMNIQVLGGLVNVGLNRATDPVTGKRSGPIDIKVLGIPIFSIPE